MNARVFSAALKEDVVTIPGPCCCECSVDNSAPVAHTAKFGMRDHIFEEPVPASGPQKIWCGDEHARCNDLCISGGHKDRDTAVGQHF